MDLRLRTAVDASVGWYDDLCALHGLGSVLADGVWSCLGPPPPLHSAVVVVEPAVPADQVAGRLRAGAPGGVKDSFASLDLAPHGMRELFSASWLHRPAPPPSAAPPAWRAVTDERGLAEWTAGHDTADVLLPGLLRSAHFRVLARLEDDRIVAGAVARLGSGVVDVSNVHAAPGQDVDWAELVAAVATHFPGRPMVGYEQGEDLQAAVAGGFTPVGDLRVWVP